MNTPKLDALLKEVEARATGTPPARDGQMRLEANGYAAPRLAAMLRVAVEALRVNAGVLQNSDKEKFPSHEMVALQWMERIAAGDQEVV